MTKTPAPGLERGLGGLTSPRTRHGRYRALVVNNWSMIAEKRAAGFQLIDIWTELSSGPSGQMISYRSFLNHVRDFGETLRLRPPEAPPNKPTPELATQQEAPQPEPADATQEAPPIRPKERFRLAREAQETRERTQYEQEREVEANRERDRENRSKGKFKMVDGWEVWMTPFPEFRREELIALNLKLQRGEVPEAEARPVLEDARREGWSKHTGIQKRQLREDQMNADHW